MTSPDGASADPKRETVGGWLGSGGPLSILGQLGQALIMKPLDAFLSGLLGAPAGSFDTVEELVFNLIPAVVRKVFRDLISIIGGIPIVGDAVEAALGGWLRDTKSQATFANNTAAAARTVAVQTVFNLTTNRPLYHGLDPTAESSYTFEGLAVSTGGSQSTQTITNTIARISKIRVGQDQIRNTISFAALKSGTPQLYVDLYRWDAEASEWHKVYSSPDLAPLVSSTLNRVTVAFSEEGYPMAAGEQFALQWRQSGSGTVSLASKTFPILPAPGFSPGAIGGSRNPTSDPAPSVISYSTMESYNDGNTPWFELGSDIGQLSMPRFYSVNFDNASWQNWVRNSVSGNSLTINSGEVQFSGTSDGLQTATYGSPTLTSRARVQVDVLSSSASPSYLLVCRDNTAGTAGAPFLRVSSTRVEIGVGAVEYVTINPGSSDWRTGPGTYRFSCDPVTDTTARLFAEKWDGSNWVVVLDTVSPVAVITTGTANRFGGIGIQRALFTNGSPLDNFILEDW
ncbi:minor tail protein [Gordonia phage Trine]|uniref:Minor tail protein n=1 Tax=Gordonia phage Trine TaxID=2201431 RepID=A0A2Z4Q8V8_9CAUD|nr:minor tail protein [Gordonia phage Trine]AWY06526.1 minor tail protein [Gordonia phage Trine]